MTERSTQSVVPADCLIQKTQVIPHQKFQLLRIPVQKGFQNFLMLPQGDPEVIRGDLLDAVDKVNAAHRPVELIEPLQLRVI